jgi:flagellar motor protein MotB
MAQTENEEKTKMYLDPEAKDRLEQDNKKLKKDIDNLKKDKVKLQGLIAKLTTENKDILKRIETCRNEKEEIAKKAKIEDKFGEVISRSLGVLRGLKGDMERRNFPVQIDDRPDRLFFDMEEVTFEFAETKIVDDNDKEAIRIIGKEFKKILDEKYIFPIDNKLKEVHLHDVMRIVIEGHTDDNSRNPIANYYVSASRAWAVLDILVNQSGLKSPDYRISVAGYAEFGRPPKGIDEITDPEVRQKRMRRVTISIVPDYDRIYPKE